MFQVVPINNQQERYGFQILEIFNHHILNTLALYDEEPRQPSDMDGWFERKNKLGYPILAALDENSQLLGFASFDQFRPQAAFKTTVENSLYVHQNHQGQGVGKALLKSTIHLAKHMNYRSMVACIDASNEASIHLHHRFGFVTRGQLPHVAKKFDQWLQVDVLQLDLSSED